MKHFRYYFMRESSVTTKDFSAIERSVAEHDKF